MIWPKYLPELKVYVSIFDVAWCLNIALNFIIIRLDMESRDPLEIALQYIKRLFVVDLVATLPPILM